MMHPIILLEALRTVKRKIIVSFTGVKEYIGSDKEITKQIIKDAWNKKGFIQVSSGHFQTFYSRDFGMIVRSLIYLGYKNKVSKTLDLVLSKFQQQGHVKVMLTKYLIGCDFPTYAPDSLAFLLHSLYELNNKKLIKKYKSYLEKEIIFFHDYVIDKNTGGIIKNRHFSSMKDYSIRKASSYDLSMAFMVQKYSNKLKLNNPLKIYDFKKLLMENYWTGSYFLDDLSGNSYISGDAQTIPFWSGLIKDKKIFKKVLQTIKESGLDYPVSLRYTIQKKPSNKLFIIDKINEGYEGNTIWVHLGLLWMEVLFNFKEKKELKKHIWIYSSLIKKYKNFMEIYNPDLTLFKGPVYISDDSMTWIALYYYLKINSEKI